jgi:hypothetical protein
MARAQQFQMIDVLPGSNRIVKRQRLKRSLHVSYWSATVRRILPVYTCADVGNCESANSQPSAETCPTSDSATKLSTYFQIPGPPSQQNAHVKACASEQEGAKTL